MDTFSQDGSGKLTAIPFGIVSSSIRSDSIFAFPAGEGEPLAVDEGSGFPTLPALCGWGRTDGACARGYCSILIYRRVE